jgi:hypothetical protein
LLQKGKGICPPYAMAASISCIPIAVDATFHAPAITAVNHDNSHQRRLKALFTMLCSFQGTFALSSGGGLRSRLLCAVPLATIEV